MQRQNPLTSSTRTKLTTQVAAKPDDPPRKVRRTTSNGHCLGRGASQVRGL